MCGILGFVGGREAAGRLDLGKVVDMLRHRGPDGEGTFRGGSNRPEDLGLTCVLVHTRLAILDLTEAAQQPMTTPDGRYTLVYNGEVYNFREIRTELEKEGFSFHSTGDTEVVLNAFIRWGATCVERFRGMFAFAVWDRDEGRLFAARDRLGIKPLYYVATQKGVAFASELRVLVEQGLTSRRISPQGLVSYLRFGSVQEPYTLVEGVRLLPAGHLLECSGGQVRLRRYWELPPATERKVTFDDAVEEIRPVLREAVSLRLVSDVPLGVFLSGGIDSSVITAIASRELDHPVHTFTVTFDEKAYSEGTYAAEVAAKFGSDHHEVHIPAARAAREIEEAMAAFDQPSADGLNTWFVSKAAREAGLRVTLSGLGGDEVFAGYPSFRTYGYIRQIGRVARVLPRHTLQRVGDVFEQLGGSPLVSRALSMAEGGANGSDTYAAIRCMFTESQVRQLVSPALEREVDALLYRAPEPSRREISDADPVNEFSRLELTGYLRNTLLRDSDVMSMSHGLEVRVPLVDHVLVEKALALPGSVKLRRAVKKPLLVSSAPRLPEAVSRRPKMGFVLPLDKWFKGPLKGWVQDRLDHVRGGDMVLNIKKTRAILDAYSADESGAMTYRVLSLASLDGVVRGWHLSPLE